MDYPQIPQFEKSIEWLKLYAQLKSEHGAQGVEALLTDVEEYLKSSIAQLKQLPIDTSLAQKEPSDLAAIRVLRPAGPRRLSSSFNQQKYLERVEGALLGRMAGCILGAPVEFWDVEKMAALAAENGDNFPPTDYWSYVPEPARKRYIHEHGIVEQYTRAKLDGVPVDDDIVYTLLGLLIAENFSLNFTTDDIAKAWMQYLPFAFSAEDFALKNLKRGVPSSKSAEIDNPYCEWIGADIRSDPWGYMAPGCPERAAEMAYRDAYISHRRQGVYGEMFFAATIAAAFELDDPIEALRIGLTEIPRDCALAKAVRWALDNLHNIADYRQARAAVDEKFVGMHGVHTINNACLTIFGIALGKRDLTKVIGATVAMGLDNDCTAATAGSIVGAVVGRQGIPKHWYKNFNNTIYAYLIGEHEFLIDDVVKRFAVQAERNLKK